MKAAAVTGFLRGLFRRPAPASSVGGGAAGPEFLYHGAYTALGYRVIRTAVRDGQLATAGSGKLHERLDRGRLLDLSREFYRDDPLYGGVIDRMADYTVGNGFTLQCKSKNPDWNRLVETWWKESFWKRPEIKQNLSGAGVEQMVATELFRSGDVGAVKTQYGKLQLVEAEQVAGPGLMDDGVKRGEQGEPLEYSVAPFREMGGVDISRARAYTPAEFLFVVKPDRPSSSRGVPPLSSSFTMLRRIADIFDSEALARNLQARLAISVTKEGGPQWGKNQSKEDATKTGAEGDPAKRIFMWDAGLVFTGKPGEKVESIQRSAPGASFEQELIPFLRFVGARLGIPLEFVYLDWTKTNYSQARAILEQAMATFVKWQELLEEFFHRPVFEWAVDRAMAFGELPLPKGDDYLAHEWIRPAWPWIDQLKEAQAYGEQLDRGLITHAQVLKSRRIDREDFLDQREREVSTAIERSQKLEKKYGVKVPYQIFMGQKPEPASTPLPGEREDRAEEGETRKPEKEAA